jgi:dipeptidyl aminopeptidase/acylaminoacyl peptidase
LVTDVRFSGGDKQRVVVSFYNPRDHSTGATEYQLTANNIWQVARETTGEPDVEHNGLTITVKQGFNQPPRLVASSKQTSRIIWDPNPQLKNIELGEASVYAWKDNEGQSWKGALYKPLNYNPHHRYPLVIQTHGFMESLFRPSGIFPTAFAARALASVGVMVLQVNEACPAVTSAEGTCAVSAYEAAANQLISEGLVDPEKIGIIGFSRSCFYVMEALTMNSLHFRAASITDGVMETYDQYLLDVGTYREQSPESESMIGAKPFGEGLQQWLKRSPGFNLDKIQAPLLVVGEGPHGTLFMWEPYAGLRFLQKPVDLMMLNTGEHVLTNPAVRMASQGGSVDWFRFWLQDYEDSDPAKAEQYKRWRELRKLQESSEPNSATPHVTSN